MVPLSLLIGAMEMVIPGLCFLIPGNMDAALVTFGQPIRLTKVPINQKPQNCPFVLTDESGQKMRRKNTRGGESNHWYSLIIDFVFRMVEYWVGVLRSVASEKMIGTWRFLISDTPLPLHNAKICMQWHPPLSCFDGTSLFDWVSWLDFWGMRKGFRD